MARLAGRSRFFDLQHLRRAVFWRRHSHDDGGDAETLSPDAGIAFRCNLCGAGNEATLAALSREAPTCARCGSNVRFRAMAYLLTKELLGRPVALPDLCVRRDLRGIGLSDAAAYPQPLAQKFDY